MNSKINGEHMTPFDPSIAKPTSSPPQTHADQAELASEVKIQQIKDIACQTLPSPSLSVPSPQTPLSRPNVSNNGPSLQNLKLLQNIIAKTSTTNTVKNQNLENKMEIAVAEKELATNSIHQVQQKEETTTQLLAGEKKGEIIAKTEQATQAAEKKIEIGASKEAIKNTDALEVMKVHFSDSTEAMKKTYALKYKSEQGTFEAQSVQNISLKNLQKAEQGNRLGSIIDNEMYLDPAYALKLGINEGTHIQVKHEDGSTQEVIVRFIPPEYRSKFKSLINEYIQQRYLQQQMQAGVSGNDTQKSTPENTQAPPLINPNKVKDVAPEDSKKTNDKKNQGLFLFTLGQLKAERANIKKNAEKRKEEAVELRDQFVKKEIESKRVLKEEIGRDTVNETIRSKEAHQKATKNDTTIHITPKPSHAPPFRKPSVMRTKIVEGKTEREE